MNPTPSKSRYRRGQRNRKLGRRFEDALRFAARTHAKQKRKGTRIPYIAHLLSVCALVIEAGGGEEKAIAALLHDAVEDQGGQPMLRRIRRRFGDQVADMVETCSDTDIKPKPKWKKRKLAYIAAIPDKSKPALLVSLADKVHNARSILSDYKRIGEKVWKRFNAKRDDVLWYYGALSKAFKGRSHEALWRELDGTVRQLRRLVSATVD